MQTEHKSDYRILVEMENEILDKMSYAQKKHNSFIRKMNFWEMVLKPFNVALSMSFFAFILLASITQITQTVDSNGVISIFSSIDVENAGANKIPIIITAYSIMFIHLAALLWGRFFDKNKSIQKHKLQLSYELKAGINANLNSVSKAEATEILVNIDAIKSSESDDFLKKYDMQIDCCLLILINNHLSTSTKLIAKAIPKLVT